MSYNKSKPENTIITTFANAIGGQFVALWNGVRNCLTDSIRRRVTFSDVVSFSLCSIVCCTQMVTGAHPRECVYSASTMKKVTKCPENKQEWIQSAKLKACHLFQQNCSSTELFQYHCLLDYTGTGLIEICAPIYHVIGQYCAEYDMKANIIQSRSGASCKSFETACPFKYSSNSSYLYQGCYASAVEKRKLDLLGNSIPSTTAKTYDESKRVNAGKNRSGKTEPMVISGFLLSLTISVALVI